jgi:hypothetical protein
MKLLGGISPFEQNPVQAKMMSKLIFTNAGSILRTRQHRIAAAKITPTHNLAAAGLTAATTPLYHPE